MSLSNTDAAKKWLSEIPGGSLAGEFEAQWTKFNAQTKPVITVFGSYDTGKSSLIRRLLVDADRDVPDWLAISARHETFEVRGVEVAGCVLRDTPGLAVGATDVRGETNTLLAKDAIGLTDVAIVTMTPQLPTGEYDLVRDLVAGGWTTGALWFAISRFDEAGQDPESDLAGYHDRATRKIAELRASLVLSEETPVFVVAQDPYQFAGADRDVDREVWDDSRGWDGMDRLAAAIERVGAGDALLFREATEQRFWSQAVLSVVGELSAQAIEFEVALTQARDVGERNAQWEESLQSLDSAARAGLKGALSEGMRYVLVNPDSSQEELVNAIRSVLDEWYKKFGLQIDLLMQDAAKASERQRSTPGWARLEELVGKSSDESASRGTPSPTRIAPILSRIGPKLLEGMTELDRLNRKRTGSRTSGSGVGNARSGSGWSSGDIAKAATMVIEAMVGIAKLVDDFRAKRAVVSARQALADQLTNDATSVAIEEWSKILDDARATIDEVMGPEATLSAGLAARVLDLRSAIDSCPIDQNGWKAK